MTLNFRAVRLASALALSGILFTACGDSYVTPVVIIGTVTAPDSVSASRTLSISVQYSTSVGCGNATIKSDSRTASQLSLTVTAAPYASGSPCLAVVPTPLTYSDSGTVSRSSPFSIYINGTLQKTVTVTSP